MRIFIINMLFLCCSVALQAQRMCGSATNHLSVPVTLASQSNSMPDEQIITIPVVVHVVYNLAAENISDAQIISQIDAINADFSKLNSDFNKIPTVFAKLAANTNIRFELAKSNPMGQATTGIVRKKTVQTMWKDDDKVKYAPNDGSGAWDAKSYLNIWVCNTVSGLTGYSSFPGAEMANDGIVVRYDAFGTTGKLAAPFNKGRTLTHEVGHWLGLKHLWGDQPCGDDGIDDTPKQSAANSGDPVFPKLSDCSSTQDGDMFMNFMDFTNDASMGMFTAGQKKSMRNLFSEGGLRNGLLKSKGLNAAWNNFEPEIMPVNTRNLAVYPNPVHAANITLLVNTTMGVNGQNFAIISTNGQIVKTGHILEMQQQIDVQNLAPGMYQIRLTDVGSTSFTNFIKN